MCRHWRVHGEYFALNSMYSSFETLSKFPLSKIMSTSFKTPFAGSALYWCFAGILWSKHNVHKQVQLLKHFCVSKPKASIAMSKNPKQKSQPFLLLKRWLVLVPLQPRIHRFPRRGLKFCLLCYLDAKLPNCEKKIPWTSLNRLAVMIWMSVPTTRTLPPIVDQTTKAVSTSARMIWSFIKPKSK